MKKAKKEKKETNSIQNTLNWAVELGVEIAKDFEDKKFTFAEALGLWDNAIKLPGIIKGFKDIPAEWQKFKDSEEYTEAIIQDVTSKVKGLSSDTSEKIVIQSIKIGIEISKFIQLCIQAHQESKR